MIGRGVRLAVVAAVCMMNLACSSGATTAAPASAPPANPVDAAFATKATAICTATTQKLSSTPDFPYPSFDPSIPKPAALLPKVGAFFAQYTIPAEEASLTQLGALGEPASGQAAWDSFVSLWAAWVANTQAQVKAAEASDAKGFVVTVDWFTTDRQQAIGSAAAAAGAPACASLAG